MSPKLFNILLVMISAVLYYGYLEPMYTGNTGLIWTPEKSISVLKNENVQYVNAIEQLSLIDEAAASVNKEYMAIDPTLIKQTEILLPKEIDPLKLRNDIISIASKSGIAITNLAVTFDGIDAYKVSFNVRARYPQFKKFMENYEKSTRIFILTGLSITHVDASAMTNSNLDEDYADKLNIFVTSKVFLKK